MQTGNQSSKPETELKEETGEGCSGATCSALFGVEIWNPLEHGIHGVPLMVPANEYNRVASNLADALLLAIQYVPLEGYDAEEIRRLERAATIPPNSFISGISERDIQHGLVV
jgi:hypothetical protein